MAGFVATSLLLWLQQRQAMFAGTGVTGPEQAAVGTAIGSAVSAGVLPATRRARSSAAPGCWPWAHTWSPWQGAGQSSDWLGADVCWYQRTCGVCGLERLRSD